MTKIRTTTVCVNGGINCKWMDVQLPQLLMTERSSSVLRGTAQDIVARGRESLERFYSNCPRLWILPKYTGVMDIAQK
jgi:hypothetical protein